MPVFGPNKSCLNPIREKSGFRWTDAGPEQVAIGGYRRFTLKNL